MVETDSRSAGPDAGAADPVAPQVQGPGAGFWRKQVTLAEEARKHHEPWWDANLNAYRPRPDDSPHRYGGDVNTNRDFTLVERKKADLFYQRPDVTLDPSPLTEAPLPVLGPDGQPQPGPNGQPQTMSALPALMAHEHILNEALGPDDVDIVPTVHRALFDVLCTAGMGVTVMGYESVTVPVETVDPMTGLPTVAPVPMHERIFWDSVSPKQVLIPYDAKTTMFDRLPWLGYKMELPLTRANRLRFHLPDEFTGAAPDESLSFDHGAPTPDGRKVFTVCVIYYKSSLYRDDILHPDHLTHLVLVDGIPQPVIHEDCPYQTLDDRGQLTPDSFKGFPIHILTTRVLSDSAYPPSDCTMIRPLVNELNRFRTQMVEYRDAMVMRWAISSAVPPDALEKFKKSPIGGIVILPEELMANAMAFRELPHGSMPRESFTSNDYIDNDIARTTAIDAAGAGVQSSSGSTTATEQQIVAANANARLDFERGRVLDWYIKGVTKFSTLVQRYFPVERASEIVGQQAAQMWDQWRQTVRGSVAFTAMPDSALRVDQAVDRRQAQELYTYLANDPFIGAGRGKLLEKLLRKFHIDPTGVVNQPPPPSPQLPSTSFAFKGTDLVEPQAPITVEMLQQLGFKISPAAVMQSQQFLATQQQLAAEAEAAQQAPNTTHGGKVAPMESLDKHQSQGGLGMQGVGGVVPSTV